MIYDKLIRDKVPDRLKEQGLEFTVVTPTNKTIQKYYLQRKIQEEVEEFLSAKTDEDKASEFADILEAVYALRELSEIPYNEIENARYKKRLHSGGFTKMIVLKEVKENTVNGEN